MSADVEVVKVCLMGRFRITCGERTLDEDSICSAKGIRLLTLLLLNRKKLVTLQEMEELLSAPGAKNEFGNSSGYIKNLVYRMRNILKNLGDSSFIISKYKSYAWNPEIPVVLDVELFEDLYEKASRQPDPAEKKRYYEEALRFYRPVTDLLMEECWMVSVDAYYGALRLEMAKNLAAIYEEEKVWEKLIRLCRDMIRSEPLDEELRRGLLKGLIMQKKVREALKEYENAEKIWNEQLGGHKPEWAGKLYQEIMAVDHGKDEALHEITGSLWEQLEEKGAYFCEKGVFYQLCTIEARKCRRKELESSMVLFTLIVKGMENQEKRRSFVMKCAKNSLRNCLGQQLRAGDVISGMGPRQFAVLLSDCPYECCDRVVSRVLLAFRKAYPSANVEVLYETARLGERQEEKEKIYYVQ